MIGHADRDGKHQDSRGDITGDITGHWTGSSTSSGTSRPDPAPNSKGWIELAKINQHRFPLCQSANFDGGSTDGGVGGMGCFEALELGHIYKCTMIVAF